MGIHRIKHTFTAGELSPMMYGRADFERYRNGCRKLFNSICTTQGPGTRRSGFKFIFDLTSLGMDTSDPKVRMIPFVFNEIQAYSMIFFKHIDGKIRVVFGTQEGLVVYSEDPNSPGNPLTTECPPGTPVSPVIGLIVYLEMPDDWDIDKFDWAQSGDEMYFAQPGLPPHIIRRYSPECWEVVQPTFTDQPIDWSNENGWPEKVTFHQQRLAFAANLIRPQTVWLSKAGDFLDFGSDTANLKDDDAVTFTLDSGTQNRIQWIISTTALYAGTIGNEWVITGSTTSALTPTNILAQRHTNNGSEPIKPLMVGIVVLFVERHGRVVNEFVYDDYGNYKTSDMIVLSRHLTDHHSIVDWTFQQTPDSIIWCVRSDGSMIALTYQRQHKVVGWHRHDTDGAFKTITCIPGDTREDDVWTVVYRNINGQDKYYVEKMEDQFKEDSAEWGRFLDSHLVYIGAPNDTFSNLDHLEGKTVDILADGTVHPQRTVQSGSITLNNNYSHVVVGLGYISEWRPLVADIQTEMGTVMGRMQRVTNFDIDFYNSLGVYLGTVNQEDGEREEEKAFRTPGDLMGVAVPLYSGIKHWDAPEGFDRKTDYFVRQYQPLPCTIRFIVDTIEVFD